MMVDGLEKVAPLKNMALLVSMWKTYGVYFICIYKKLM